MNCLKMYCLYERRQAETFSPLYQSLWVRRHEITVEQTESKLTHARFHGIRILSFIVWLFALNHTIWRKNTQS
jgi:hypothetical protein